MSVQNKKNLVIAALLFFCSVFAYANPSDTSTQKNYLFLQTAKTGLLKPTQVPGIYQLALKDISPYVTYFTDRPNRMTGLLPMERFLEIWQSNAKNGFKADAPNVAVEGIKLHAVSKDQTIGLVVVLSKPIYDRKTKTLTYTAQALNHEKITFNHNIKLENVALFVDNIASCPSCCCG